MTFGTTERQPWVEALPAEQGRFAGRTFSRFHIVNAGSSVPTVGEIWATSDHAVESHAHDADELLYILSGAIAVNGRRLGSNEVETEFGMHCPGAGKWPVKLWISA